MGFFKKAGLTGLILGSSCVGPYSDVSENFSKPPFYNLSDDGSFFEKDVRRCILLKEFVDENLWFEVVEMKFYEEEVLSLKKN